MTNKTNNLLRDFRAISFTYIQYIFGLLQLSQRQTILKVNSLTDNVFFLLQHILRKMSTFQYLNGFQK